MGRIVAWKEPGWFDPRADLQMWRHLTRAYKVGYELLDWDQMPEFAEGEAIVILDEQGTVELGDFEHPENAVYVFGHTHQNDLINIPHDHSVVIDTPDREPCLFGIQAAAIILEDRKRKNDR